MSHSPHASTATIERLIVGKAVEGFLTLVPISVETGDKEPLLEPCDDVDRILAAVFASESDEVWLFGPDRRPFVKLVLGNGVDVISDYTVSLAVQMEKADALARALEA